MHKRLIDANPFGTGDSTTKHYLGTIPEYSKRSNNNDDKNGQLPFSVPSQTIQYINTNLIIEEFERDFDMNEILGLNDMKTEKPIQETYSATSNHYYFYNSTLTHVIHHYGHCISLLRHI